MEELSREILGAPGQDEVRNLEALPNDVETPGYLPYTFFLPPYSTETIPPKMTIFS
jgi:hypothetical protein